LRSLDPLHTQLLKCGAGFVRIMRRGQKNSLYEAKGRQIALPPFAAYRRG
jgi:hypothetical protein